MLYGQLFTEILHYVLRVVDKNQSIHFSIYYTVLDLREDLEITETFYGSGVKCNGIRRFRRSKMPLLS